MTVLRPRAAVMHESSRKVAETLQEIYSPEWDGHGELKAIADVSPSARPRGAAGGLGGLGCFTPLPASVPPRATTCCGRTTRPSWPTKPCA